MSRKKILLSMDPQLLQELDQCAHRKKMSRSALISLSVSQFLESQKKAPLSSLEALREGYRAMGEINRALAEEALFADNEQFAAYEHFLSESEAH